MSYNILYLRVVTSGYREYVSLYYCVYSTIEIALSAWSSKYNTNIKYIVYIVHLMYLSTTNSYCNCRELLKEYVYDLYMYLVSKSEIWKLIIRLVALGFGSGNDRENRRFLFIRGCFVTKWLSRIKNSLSLIIALPDAKCHQS